MDCEEKFWLWFWSITVVGIVLVGAIIAIGVNYNDRQFIKGGYTAGILPGHTGWVWVKDPNSFDRRLDYGK